MVDTPHSPPTPLLAALLQSGRFFLPQGEMQAFPLPRALYPWEIFRGHLLDASQTRAEKTLEGWEFRFRWTGIADDPAEAWHPLLGLLFDAESNAWHVVRQVRVYGHEAYEPEPNVIASREVQRWRRELVATVNGNSPDLTQELSHVLELALVGISRLPITSIESPLPAFALGQLAWFPHCPPGDRPLDDIRELIEVGIRTTEASSSHARVLETALRATPLEDSASAAATFLTRWQALGGNAAQLAALLRTLFGQLALSPYTGLGRRLVAWLQAWLHREPALLAEMVAAVSYMIRHLVRHLTSFDLITFHNRGSNYPDALLLDDLLKFFLSLLAKESAESTGHDTLVRRALRQGLLMRRLCQGLPVPSAPTSPGENLRVLPAEFPRVPEEEILYAVKRTGRLFAAESPAELEAAAQPWLSQALSELNSADELLELGIGTFLDRPCGAWKEPGEVDRTPLLSYVAWSAELCRERLGEMQRWSWLTSDALAELKTQVSALSASRIGVAAQQFTGEPRPGVVALEDARQAADDFIFLRTTTSSWKAFWQDIDDAPLAAADPALTAWLGAGRGLLCIRAHGASLSPSQPLVLRLLDRQGHERLQLVATPATADRYRQVRGQEQIAAGWQAVSPGSGQSPIALPLHKRSER